MKWHLAELYLAILNLIDYEEIVRLVAERTTSPDHYLPTFFFFQAEDGIRDLTVTGVQTCALPISLRRSPRGFRNPGRIRPTNRATLAVRCRDGPGLGELLWRWRSAPCSCLRSCV